MFSRFIILINKFKINIFPNKTNSLILGRWKLKSSHEIDYYMKNIYADPGYVNQFLKINNIKSKK